MRYLMTFLALLSLSQAHCADWTPVFGDTLTPQSQKQLLGNKKPVKNFYPKIVDMVLNQDDWTHKGMRLTANAQKGVYSTVPEPYRHDMQPAVTKKLDECTTEIKVPLANATLFGKPIQSFDYHICTCEMAPFNEFITFNPMSDSAFKQFEKQVKFKENKVNRAEAECTDQKSYPAGELSNADGKAIFTLVKPHFDCE